MNRTRLMMVVGLVFAFGLFAWGNYFRVNITNRQPSGSTIIAFGDSLTAGFGVQQGEDYPTHLARLIGRDVVNRGVSGETTAHALRRLKEDVLDADPAVVIVLLGGNDMLQRLPISQQFGNLATIVERIQSEGAMVVLVGLKGMPFDQGYGEEYENLARRLGCIFVPNVMRGIIDNPKLKYDQVHPNADGYRLIAERVAEELKPYLE